MKTDLKDFDEFKNSDGPAPSSSLTQTLFARVNCDLNPSAWQIFGKLSFIHCVTAVFTLSLCPQFGIRLFGKGLGLMGYFMNFGDYVCGLACGSVFLGASVLIATFLLKPEEIRVLRRNQILEFGALTLLSLGVFVMLHAEIVIGFALAWILGTILGGAVSFEVARSIREKLLYQYYHQAG